MCYSINLEMRKCGDLKMAQSAFLPYFLGIKPEK